MDHEGGEVVHHGQPPPCSAEATELFIELCGLHGLLRPPQSASGLSRLCKAHPCLCVPPTSLVSDIGDSPTLWLVVHGERMDLRRSRKGLVVLEHPAGYKFKTTPEEWQEAPVESSSSHLLFTHKSGQQYWPGARVEWDKGTKKGKGKAGKGSKGKATRGRKRQVPWASI